MRPEEPLIGRWVSDPEDDESRQVHGLSAVEFAADGSLLTLTNPGGEERLTSERYTVDGDDLVITSESGLLRKRVAYSFTDDGRLVLGLGEGESRYVRLRDG